jgi:mRNA-degrading endonuclease RelE of RelBE toxin-antitoxin system
MQVKEIHAAVEALIGESVPTPSVKGALAENAGGPSARFVPRWDVKLLRGAERLWRLRVGEWRVIVDRRDDERVIDVLTVSPRGRAYR